MGGLVVSTGIAIGAAEETTIRDIQGRDSSQATEVGQSEHPAFSGSWNDFAALQPFEPPPFQSGEEINCRGDEELSFIFLTASK